MSSRPSRIAQILQQEWSHEMRRVPFSSAYAHGNTWKPSGGNENHRHRDPEIPPKLYVLLHYKPGEAPQQSDAHAAEQQPIGADGRVQKEVPEGTNPYLQYAEEKGKYGSDPNDYGR